MFIDWIGLGQQKWSHVQLCLGVNVLRVVTRVAINRNGQKVRRTSCRPDNRHNQSFTLGFTTKFRRINSRRWRRRNRTSVADFERGRAGSALPYGRRTDAVTHGTPDM